MSNQTIYEQPLNERVRTLLRLEYLFNQFDYFFQLPDPFASRSAIDSLQGIIQILCRPELKNELSKELDRYGAKLKQFRQQRGVNLEALDAFLGHLNAANTGVQQFELVAAQNLRDHEFLKAISQRSGIAGGSCAFDLPQLHYWLKQPIEQRHQQLQDWIQQLLGMRHAMDLLLSLLRDSDHPSEQIAEQGTFQQFLEQQTDAQLLRVGLSPDVPIFPRISGDKHRFCIRFFELTSFEKVPQPTTQDVQFYLTCCLF